MNKARRSWIALLIVHLICYEIFFIYSLDSFKFTWYLTQQNFIVLLFWTPILLLHVGAHYYQNGRGDVSRVEREAYRDGFADAVRQLKDHSDSIERLMLDNEGELVEIGEKRKRREG